MSVKISKDAKMEYDKLISGRNFRQKDQIVRAYNESIKGYNNFRKAISRSNFNEAAQELSSAALKLAAAVEWAEKYVIFNKYSLLKQTEFDQSKIDEWDRRCRFVKVKHNKEQNMTTHDLMKLIKSDFKNEILKSGASFTNMDNEEVRCALINGYKHNGTEPDSSAYIQTMEELYKFINILILKGDEKNKLKGITDNYPNSWEELFISCGYFKPNRNRRYILLTGDINDDKIVRNLFRINWDMVLDLSVEDVNGLKMDLFDQYVALPDRKRVIKKYLCDFKSNDQLPITPQTYWIKINGRKNERAILDDKHLVSKYIRNNFNKLLDAFTREYDLNIELVILGCTSFMQSAFRILQTFGDVYIDSEDLQLHFLNCDNIEVKNNILRGNFIDKDICKFYDLNLEDFSREISASIGEYNQVSEDKIYIPSATSELGYIEFDDYNAMKSVMDIVYIDIEKKLYEEKNKQERGVAFLKGDISADWDIVNDENYVIAQKNEISIRDDIIRCMQDGSRFIYKVEYEAGLGGTTFMRKLAFLLHDDYPTVVVSRYIESDLVKYLLEIYMRSRKGIIIFADSNNLSFNETMKLQNELLRESQFSFVIVYIARKQEDLEIHRRLSRFDYLQCMKMQKNLLPHCINQVCVENLKRTVEKAKISQREEEALPFILAMYAFDEKFNGIANYVKHSLNSIEDKEQNIICILALADYVNYRVSGQFFKNVYGMKKLREMQSDEYTLAPMIKVGNDISGKKITFQLKYSLFTKEVLKYFSRGESVSFTSLSDRIINIIKYSRRDTDSEIDGETIKLLNKLFIEREGNQVENVINIKGVYSPLITQLVEENKRNNKNQYDDSENVVVNIFKALVEYYPEEPHFAGHLARYYFYTMHNYELGFEMINEAIESAKEKEQYSMGSLYHIKAMGYSARIQRQYIDAIMKSIEHSKKRRNCESDIETVVQYIREIRTDYNFALQLFETARQENTSKFVSNIAQCELLLRIQTCYDLIRNWCEDLKIQKLVTDEEQMELYDQIDDIIEDCEYILSVGKGQSNNYNMDLLRKIKEDTLLTRAKGEEIKKICKQLISSGTSDAVTRARRKLARIQYAEIRDNLYIEKGQKQLKEIVMMMEQNIEADVSNNSNFRIWFKALRALEVEDVILELDSAFQKLEKWTTQENTSSDAFFYKYVVKFIQAYEEGILETSSKVQKDLNNLLLDLNNSSREMLRTTKPFEWFTDYGTGLRRLISNSDLIQLDRINAIKTLHHFIGELPSKDCFNGKKAYISFAQQKVYFNPQSIRDRITGIHENQYVDFGIGFSYDGLRSYHDSIKIHRGAIKKFEPLVPKSGEHVKVRVIGFNKSYIKTEIVESNGEKCDIKIKDMLVIGIKPEMWKQTDFEFEVVLLKKNKLENGKVVWWIDLVKTLTMLDQSMGNRPFERILRKGSEHPAR